MTGPDALKTASKKVVHKAAEATDELADKVPDKNFETKTCN